MKRGHHLGGTSFAPFYWEIPQGCSRGNGRTDPATSFSLEYLAIAQQSNREKIKKKTNKGSFSLSSMAICHESNRQKIPHAKISPVVRLSGRARPRRPFGARSTFLMAKYTCRPHEMADEKEASPRWHLFFSLLLGDSPRM